MTMISPEQYADDIKDLSYEKLVSERNELIEALHRFENQYTPDAKPDVCDYSDVVYQMQNQYLVEITELLNEKYNKIVWSRET